MAEAKKKAVPDLNPFLAPVVICPQCGTKVVPEPIKQKNGLVISIGYFHKNEEVGCSWRGISNGERFNGNIMFWDGKEKVLPS